MENNIINRQILIFVHFLGGNMKNKKNQKEIDLLQSIIVTKQELLVANKNFEGAEDDLIDYYSYEIKANKAKLNYLIKQVKQKNIKLDMMNNLKIGTTEKIEVI